MSRLLTAIAGLSLALAGCARTPHEPASPKADGRPLSTKAVSQAHRPAPAKSAPTPTKDAVAPEGETNADRVAPIIQEAARISQNGNGIEALKRFDDALKIDPDNRQTLFLSGRLAQRIAMDLERPQNNELFLKSARTLRKLRDIYKNLSDDEKIMFETALYNEACTYAINGKTELALDSLAEASDAGFSQLGLIDADEELASIRDRPKFREVRAKVAERAQVQARERVRMLFANSKSFAFDFKLPNLDGKIVSLADFKGKITIVDLWGTWCKPCRNEVPHLATLYRKYHDKGLEIVGLTYELASTKDVKATIKAFAKEHGIPYPCLIGDARTHEQIPSFEGFPTSLYIDRAGKVRVRLVGFVQASGQEIVMEEIVKKLLSEDAGATTSNP